jgi:hypothetical protein
VPLPDFVSIGAQKAGTSSIFGALRGHPGLRLPERKELHFFDRDHANGLDWYRDQFPGPVTGEATPYYLFHPVALERLRAAVPAARLVVVLRDPRARAVSHYWHEVRLGHEDLPLGDALAAEEARLAGEEERIRADPAYRGWRHQHFSYVARGHYAPQLRRLLTLFPRSQVAVLRFEEVVADPRRHLDDLGRFLGVGPFPEGADLPAMNVGAYDPPSPEVARFLDERFAGWEASVAPVLAGG